MLVEQCVMVEFRSTPRFSKKTRHLELRQNRSVIQDFGKDDRFHLPTDFE